MAATGIHVSLSAEPIANIGGLVVTNSMFTSLIVSGLLIVFAVIVNRSLKQTNKPSGLQNFAEWIIESLYNLVYSVTGDLKKTSLFFPLVSTFFLFILLNNWIGLIPGVGTIVVPLAHSNETIIEEPVTAPVPAEMLEEEHSATPETTEEELHSEIPADSELTEHATDSEITEMEVAEHAFEEQHEAEEHHAETVPLFRPGSADLNTTIALGIFSVLAVQLFGFKALSFSLSPSSFIVFLLSLVISSLTLCFSPSNSSTLS